MKRLVPIVLAALAVATAAPAAAIPDPTPVPVGGDPGWHTMAENCYQGSMRACDALANTTRDANAPVFFDYGFSCGGRVHYSKTDTSNYSTCLAQYPSNP